MPISSSRNLVLTCSLFVRHFFMKVKYIPQVMAMGTCPDEPRAFFMQQYRWCMGSTTLLCNREFWGSSLTGMQKLCYLSGMFYYSATAVVRKTRMRVVVDANM